MSNDLYSTLEDNPVIPGIKDDTALKAVLSTKCKIVFILYGNISDISEIVKKIKDRGKMVFIDIDILDGFPRNDIVVQHLNIVLQYLKEYTQADGIISSKASMLKSAKAHGFLTIHRFFLIDAFSLHNLHKQIEISKPDCIEILPGAIPKIISLIVKKIDMPLIAGGLILEKNVADEALKAGAKAISSTNLEIWSM